jgi:transcriptional regulator with PAS, ATPase and Fis domain
LQNLIERVVVLSQSDLISKAELPIAGPGNSNPIPKGSLKDMVGSFEKEAIAKALAENGGNISQAAKALEIARTSLITRMKSLGINPSP